MAEPARKIYDEDDQKYAPKSARKRADDRWGMSEPDEPPEADTGQEEDSDEGLSARERADDRWGMTPDDIENAEEAAGSPETSKTADKEKEGLDDDQIGSGYEDEDKGKGGRQKFWTRKRAAAGGGIVTLLFGGFSIFGALQGPAAAVNAAQMLSRFHFFDDESFMDGRAGSLIKWAKTRDEPNKRNLGYFGNKIANHYETKLTKSGMSPNYEGRRIKSVDLDSSNPKSRAILDDMRASGVELEDIGDGRFRANLDTGGVGSTRSRRLALKGMIDGMGMNKVSSAVAKRTLTRRAGVDWHPLKNISRSIDEDIHDFWRARREERNQRRSNGADDLEGRTFRGEDAVDEDGNPVDNPENDAHARDLNTDIDGSRAEVSGRFRGLLGDAAGIAGIATIICAVDEIGDHIPSLKQANLILPLMRIGIEIVSLGNQVMNGDDVNLDEVGATVEQFYDIAAEPGAESFFGAKSIQAELGKAENGPDMPNGAKPNTDKPEVFKIIDRIIDATGIGNTICSAVTSTVGGWLVDIVDWATSGGPAQILVAVVTDQLSGIVLNHFIDDIVGWIVGEPLVTDAAGALLGNYANYGALLAANDAAISHGAVALGPAQVLGLKADRDAQIAAKLQNKSFYDRYLNPYDTDSLFANALIKNPVSAQPGAVIASIFRSPSRTFSSLFGLFTPNARAEAQYDYGFPKFGFSIEEAEMERYDNPMENADRVESNLAHLNDKYGECFKTTVNPETFALQTNTEEAVNYSDLEDKPDCHNGSEELTDYRFYLADAVAARSLACFEGFEEAACNELGFGGAPPSGAPNANADPGTDTSNLQCPEGTEDGGVHQDYGPGQVPTVQIRICGIPNAIAASQGVNASIAAQSLSMIQAMQSEGIDAHGWAFRSYDRQVQLRREHCGTSDYAIYEMPARDCNPDTAKPGSSMHEVGLAIDFSSISGACGGATCAGNRTYDWLTQNAARYGFTKLSSEAWHWSVTGG